MNQFHKCKNLTLKMIEIFPKVNHFRTANHIQISFYRQTIDVKLGSLLIHQSLMLTIHYKYFFRKKSKLS